MVINPNFWSAIDKLIAAGGTMYVNARGPIVRAMLNQKLIVIDDNDINPAHDAERRATLSPAVVDALDDTRRAALTAAMNASPTTSQEPALGGTSEGTGTDAATDPAPTAPAPAPTTQTRTMIKPDIRASSIRIALPDAVRAPSAKRAETYAFGKLQAPDEQGLPDSFFVAATAEMPKPWKHLKPAVHSANGRYKTERKEPANAPDIFAIRYMPMDPEFNVPGARVFRVR